jgi:hypothetical protein
MPLHRQLHCSHCYHELTKHKVYKVGQLFEDSDNGTVQKIKYDAICMTCKTGKTAEVSLANWKALLKNRHWNVKR